MNNRIIYTISVLIASIIFLSVGTRRVFQVELLLSSYVVPLSAMCIVSSTPSICSALVCGLLIGWH